MGVLLSIFPLLNYATPLWTITNAKNTLILWRDFWQTTFCSNVDLNWQLVILFSNDNNSILYATRYVDVVFLITVSVELVSYFVSLCQIVKFFLIRENGVVILPVPLISPKFLIA